MSENRPELEINIEKQAELSKRIKKETNRLKKLFCNMPADTMKKIMSLISNAAFMTVTLEDLQETINREGAVSKYQNGENQWGFKKSPEIEIYNTMVKNHMSIMKQLTDLTPEKNVATGKVDDPFLKILKRESNG